VPPRKIGKTTVSRLRRYALEQGVSMLEAARDCDSIDSISKGPRGKIKQFVQMFDRLAEICTEEVELIIKAVLDETAYRDWLTDDGSEESHERAANVDELIVAASEFDREHPHDGGLERYLEQAALVSDTDVWESTADFVSLMTMHAAKGLEFPCVYIVGLEDGILPHERSSQSDEDIEEERRLLFVGITRAEEELQLSRSMSRFRRGSYWPTIASRFLMELPRESMEVFEPATDEIDPAVFSQLDSWLHGGVEENWVDDSLAVGVQDEVDISFDPEMFESADSLRQGIAKQKKNKPAMPRIFTGTELAEEREKQQGNVRVHPNAFQIGMKVEHLEYGIGQVVMLSGKDAKKTATVDFPGLGKKRFRLAFCNLQIVAE
jgi:DNA helicase-2/ATP-dependent DNA helicase PcrA